MIMKNSGVMILKNDSFDHFSFLLYPFLIVNQNFTPPDPRLSMELGVLSKNVGFPQNRCRDLLGFVIS